MEHCELRIKEIVRFMIVVQIISLGLFYLLKNETRLVCQLSGSFKL
jgi:hypothetical protein